MDKLSTVWAELQKSNRLPSGTLMATCQTELQELMYQLDVMLSKKEQQWLQETEQLEAQLQEKEKEMRSQRTALDMKNREMEDMKNKMGGLNKTQKSIVDEYEEHLSKLRAEVLKVQKEYEKLHKQHLRYKKDLLRKRDQVLAEKKESEDEICRLKDKLEEYESREREWELKMRSQQREIDMLQDQKRTLVEKCKFIQHQSHTYQSPNRLRHGVQDADEESLRYRISQLESNVDRNILTIESQKEKIEKLKSSLESTVSTHKQTMEDNEKLLEDLQKANETIQFLEKRMADLQTQLHSKVELLQAAHEDSQQYNQNLLHLEHTLNTKDDIIRQMVKTHDCEDSEQVRRLKEVLQNAGDDLTSKNQNMKPSRQIVSSSSTSTSSSETDCRLQQDSAPQQTQSQETDHQEEVQHLQLEVQKLQKHLATVRGSHNSELKTMKLKLGELSAELHQRNSLLARLTEKSSDLEQSLLDETDMLTLKIAELKVAQSHIESLRSENQYLKQKVWQQEEEEDCNQSSFSIPKSHVNHGKLSRVYEKKNIHLNCLKPAHKDLCYHSVKLDKKRSSLGKGDEQLHLLETQKVRLEAETKLSSWQNHMAAEDCRLHTANEHGSAQYPYHPDETQGSEPMSLVSESQFPAVDRLEMTHSTSEDEFPDMAEEASKAFYHMELEHANLLERQLSAQIDNFINIPSH